MKPGIFAIHGNLTNLTNLIYVDAHGTVVNGGYDVTYREGSDTVVLPRTFEANRIADVKPNDRRDYNTVIEEARRNYRKRNA